MKLRINYSPNAKIIFSVLLVVLLVAASTIYVFIPQNGKRIELLADIAATKSEIDALKNVPLDIASLSTERENLQNRLAELQEKLQGNDGSSGKAGSVDTSVSNVVALVGGLAEAVSLNVSKFEVLYDDSASTEYEMIVYGSYSDISTFLQAMHSLDMVYEVRYMFMQPVILDEHTKVPIPVPGATTPQISPSDASLASPSPDPATQNNGIRPYTGGSTPATQTAQSSNTNPNANGGTPATQANANGGTPATQTTQTNANGDTHAAESAGQPSSVPTVPTSGSTQFSWTFGEGTDVMQETPLFDPATGRVLESVYDVTLQMVIRFVVTKNTSGVTMDVVENRNLTPQDPFSEDRHVVAGRFGYPVDYMGEGTKGVRPFDEKMGRIILDEAFRKSEIVRTRAVIDNRKNAGLDISEQLAYLHLLVAVDVEMSRGKYVDRKGIIQNFPNPQQEADGTEGGKAEVPDAQNKSDNTPSGKTEVPDTQNKKSDNTLSGDASPSNGQNPNPEKNESSGPNTEENGTDVGGKGQDASGGDAGE